MSSNHHHGPPDLAGGRVLGPQQAVAVDVRMVPGLNLSVIDRVGDVQLSRACLQVVDLSTGKAMITPVDARWMRQFAEQLQRAADGLDARAGVGSEGPQSSPGG